MCNNTVLNKETTYWESILRKWIVWSGENVSVLDILNNNLLVVVVKIDT